MQYLKHTEKDGVAEPDEVVDEAYVERFIGRDTLDWFRGLGGSEWVTIHNDVIRNVSISPDRKEQRVTTFTPIDAPKVG